MRTLDIWDWKYRIFLSESVLKKVNCFVNVLQPEEKNIYKTIIDFYYSFYSFDVLLDIIIEEKSEINQIINLAKNNIDKAIKAPSILEEYYTEKINIACKDNEYVKEQLKNILALIIDDDRFCIEIDEVQKVIFGKWYSAIEKSVLQRGNILDKNKDNNFIEIKDVKLYTNKLIANIKNNYAVLLNFGEYLISEYDINIIKNVGFAEWWDRDLINEEKDVLVLYDNKDALNSNDFEYTIYHEIYPGHGQFYNFARANKSTIPNFDHGAMSLIEGWATFCEWNIKDSQYSRDLRNRGKEFLNISLFMPIKNKEKVELYSINKIYI